MRHVVYRWFDAEGRLLYVGATENMSRRMIAHSTRSPWWPRARRGEAIVYETREEALRAEREAISAEGPEFNKSGGVQESLILRRDVAPGDCNLCGKPLGAPTNRLGRPPLRHPECQIELRRSYDREYKRTSRARKRGQPSA